jgi:hypothetical protein
MTSIFVFAFVSPFEQFKPVEIHIRYSPHKVSPSSQSSSDAGPDDCNAW